MPSPFNAVLEVPFDKLSMHVINDALRELAYLPESTPTINSSDALIARLARQLDAYYIDACATFDIPLALADTDFQLHVWQAIGAILCGSVITYGTITQQIDSVPHAIGQACSDNWFPILIPCHHVVSASDIGKLLHHTDGYLLNTKHWLLHHKGVMLV